jgi:hypothetical protein
VNAQFKDVGLKSYVPIKAPRLQRRHRIARLEFGREHQNWDDDLWSQILFTDETRFCVNSIDREKLYRRQREQNAQFNFTPTVSFGGGSVMVWRGICLGARTELAAIDGSSLTGETYTRDILQDHVIRFASYIGEDFTLMQNNVRRPVAQCVTHFLYQVGIPTINSPACSPDLSPIEHVCDMLGRRLRSRIHALYREEEVKFALIEKWDSLPQEMINGLIRSMGRRMTAVVKCSWG